MLAKGPPWMKAGRAAQRLHHVRVHRVAHQDGHRGLGADVAAAHRVAAPCVPDDDVAEPLLQVDARSRARQKIAMTSEAAVIMKFVFAGDPAEGAAESHNHLSQRPVVHVHGPAPGDPPVVEPRRCSAGRDGCPASRRGGRGPR